MSEKKSYTKLLKSDIKMKKPAKIKKNKKKNNTFLDFVIILTTSIYFVSYCPLKGSTPSGNVPLIKTGVAIPMPK